MERGLAGQGTVPSAYIVYVVLEGCAYTKHRQLARRCQAAAQRLNLASDPDLYTGLLLVSRDSRATIPVLRFLLFCSHHNKQVRARL